MIKRLSLITVLNSMLFVQQIIILNKFEARYTHIFRGCLYFVMLTALDLTRVALRDLCLLLYFKIVNQVIGDATKIVCST